MDSVPRVWEHWTEFIKYATHGQVLSNQMHKYFCMILTRSINETQLFVSGTYQLKQGLASHGLTSEKIFRVSLFTRGQLALLLA